MFTELVLKTNQFWSTDPIKKALRCVNTIFEWKFTIAIENKMFFSLTNKIEVGIDQFFKFPFSPTKKALFWFYLFCYSLLKFLK